MDTLDTLVGSLQKANWAYHNGGELLMTDEEYDRRLEELKARCPTHPFLSVIGAPVSKGGVILPFVLGSLDKMRYGEGTLEKWMIKQKLNDFIVSEKLDGLSALYVCNGKGKRNMYLRGDGIQGVDVSRIFEVMTFPPHKCIVRGELVLPLTSTPEGSIGRSLVNGWLHRIVDKKGGVVPEELKGVHFVGYQMFETPATFSEQVQLLGEPLNREEQLRWLQARGFRVPWSQKGNRKDFPEEYMKTLLLKRKEESKYPLDGLVIGVNDVPKKVEGEAKNPDDSVAFKAALEDQKKDATVIQVEWNVSRQGVLIPRIQIEPVEVGGAKIQWISGHNAAAIVSGNIGKGTRVRIRRSGDVIPMIEEVLEGTVAQLPDGEWEWDGVHIRRKGEETKESASVICTHALQTLGVEGIGPGLVSKLVENGYKSVGDIWRAKEDDLAKCIGGGRGPELKRKLKEAYEKANQATLLLASNKLPRGVGEKKLRGLYEKEADARKWETNIQGIPTGWTKDTYEALLSSLNESFEWIRNTFGEMKKEEEIQNGSQQKNKKLNGKQVVFSGVRDKDVEKTYMEVGWELGDSVNKKTGLLIISDSAKGETTKTKKATELGIKIIRLSQWKEFL